MADDQILENDELDFNARCTELTGLTAIDGKKPKIQHVVVRKISGSGENVVDEQVNLASEETLLLIKTALDDLKAYTDGLEALITSSNTKIDSLNTYVDGVEALITTLAGYIDGVEALISTSNTKLDSVTTAITTLQGYVDTLETLLGNMQPMNTVTETTITVGTSSTLVLATSGTRKGAFVQNISDVDIWLTETAASAVLNDSFVLPPFYVYQVRGQGNVRCISGTASKKVRVGSW